MPVEGVATRVWEPRTLDSAAALDREPPQMPPAEAQPWCNFVVFTPGRVPAGCVLEQGTLRREAPPGRVGDATAGRTPWSASNPAAYRFEVAAAGRRLRVKEFLYDWAFPALDHPCLWKSHTHATPVGDGDVLWYGTDYMGHRGASARIARTMIELSVLEGMFTDGEVLDLYRSLRPVDPAAAAAIAGTPLALLSYWARRPEAETVDVPLGLWKIHQSGEARMRWAAGGEAERLAGARGLPARLGGLALDSAAEEVAGAGWSAAEFVYSGGPGRGRELRLYLGRSAALGAAPERDDHPGRSDVVTAGPGRVDLAWIDERHGPFDAVISGAQGVLRLLSSTGVGLGRAWFLGAIAEIGR